jgi:hypothetical protein
MREPGDHLLTLLAPPSSGSSPSYCGTGCDVDFGSCSPRPGGVGDSTNGLCGKAFSASCAKFGDKNCCSKFGFW